MFAVVELIEPSPCRVRTAELCTLLRARIALALSAPKLIADMLKIGPNRAGGKRRRRSDTEAGRVGDGHRRVECAMTS